VPGDWNGDGQIDWTDWQDYQNGRVLASVLWNLSPEGQYGSGIWEALKNVRPSNSDRGLTAEDWYNFLRTDAAVPADDLWRSFSRHYVNLSAVRWGGVALDWLDYRGVTDPQYAVTRREQGQSKPDFICRLGASWGEACERGLDQVRYDPADALSLPNLQTDLAAWTTRDDRSSWLDRSVSYGTTYIYTVSPRDSAGVPLGSGMDSNPPR